MNVGKEREGKTKRSKSRDERGIEDVEKEVLDHVSTSPSSQVLSRVLRRRLEEEEMVAEEAEAAVVVVVVVGCCLFVV